MTAVRPANPAAPPGIDQRYFELRAEWLKLRGALHDPTTSLPTLGAVLEDVRRRLETGEVIGVIYLDLSGEEHLESVYGWEAYERLIRDAALALGDLRGGLLGFEDAIAMLGVRNDEFVLFVRGGERARAEDEWVESVRSRLVAELATRLRVELGSTPRPAAIESASALLRPDPTVRLERQVYRAVDRAKSVSRVARDGAQHARLTELRRILEKRDVEVRFQPIVTLADGHIHGYEALSRGPIGDVFESAEVLFAFAERTQLMRELERICRSEALRSATGFEHGCKIFLNTSPFGLMDDDLLAPDTIALARRAGIAEGDTVIEITERAAITEWQELRRNLDRLRQAGYRIAIDDVGSGYSSLISVVELEPDYLKFDLSLVRDIHHSPIKRNLLETVLVLADKIGASVIAEGVERPEELAVLREMGVPHAQGFYFGRPLPRPSGETRIPLPGDP